MLKKKYPLLFECEHSVEWKQGLPFPQIPHTLSTILPDMRLFNKKSLPGVYGIFFPQEKKIYIGQSKNITFEVSMYTTKKKSNT